MERAGLVRSSVGKAQDLRWATYSITKEGERLFQRALPEVVALNERLLDGIPAAQRETLDRQLARMLANLDKEKEEK